MEKHLAASEINAPEVDHATSASHLLKFCDSRYEPRIEEVQAAACWDLNACERAAIENCSTKVEVTVMPQNACDVRVKPLSDNADRGVSDLSISREGHPFASGAIGTGVRLIGHPQEPAQDVHARLTLLRPIIGKSRHRIDTGQPDGWLLTTDLSGCGREAIVENPSELAILLGMLKARRCFRYELPPIGNHEGNQRPNSGDPCERQLENIEKLSQRNRPSGFELRKPKNKEDKDNESRYSQNRGDHHMDQGNTERDQVMRPPWASNALHPPLSKSSLRALHATKRRTIGKKTGGQRYSILVRSDSILVQRKVMSAEVLIGPINMGLAHVPDWLIIEGECSPGTRPMSPDWVRGGLVAGGGRGRLGERDANALCQAVVALSGDLVVPERGERTPRR